MATEIRHIVDSVITVGSVGISEAGFGIPLVLAETFYTSNRSETYSSLSAVTDAGYPTTHNVYKMANLIFAQDKTPQEIRVGRKLANVNAKQTLTFDALATAGTYTLTLGAETTGPIDWNETAAATEVIIEDLTEVTSVTVTGDMPSLTIVVEFDGADVNTAFDTMTANVGSLTGVTTGTVTVDQYGSTAETWSEAYSAVKAEDNDWYCLLPATQTEADIIALAAIVEADSDHKIMIVTSIDDDILTTATDDVCSELQDSSYKRTALAYSVDADNNWLNAAWAGRTLPETPGSVNWAYNVLRGISGDTLTDTEITNMENKYCQRLETVGGQTCIVSKTPATAGVTFAGSPYFLDIVRGIDYLEARIEEGLFALMVASKKIPYTNNGLSLIEMVLRERLEIYGVQSGLLDPTTITVTVPDVSAVSSADKTNRNYSGITWSATLQGAINKITINGTVVT